MTFVTPDVDWMEIGSGPEVDQKWINFARAIESYEMYTKVAKLRNFIDKFITGWSAWTSWSACAESCGDSFKYRTRVCEVYDTNEECVGEPIEKVPCSNGKCPTFSEWTPWTTCQPSCGDGESIRLRLE